MGFSIPDTDFTGVTAPTVPATPKRVQCGHYLSAGITSHRCELGIGHEDIWPADPEPHYSMSVYRSVQAWQQWAKREWERQQNPEVTLVTEDDEIVCPAGVVGCDLTFPHSHGTTDEAGHPDHEQIFVDPTVSVGPGGEPDDGTYMLDHRGAIVDPFAHDLEQRAREEHAAFRRGWDAAVERVEAKCVEWDSVTKGESPTTATLRALFTEEPDDHAAG